MKIRNMLSKFWLPLSWLLLVIFLFWGGSFNDVHTSYGKPLPDPHLYPWNGILTLTSISFIEMIVLYFLTCYKSSVKILIRSFIALILFGTWGFFTLILLMHSPIYFYFHALWKIIVFILLIYIYLSNVIFTFSKKHLKQLDR
jgi:hypothetical protein